MTKYLVRFTKDKDGKKVCDFQSVKQELIHEYHEVEDLPYKEGFFAETYWNEEENKLKQRYVEIPKTETEKLREELEIAKGSIVELTQMIAIAGGE